VTDADREREFRRENCEWWREGEDKGRGECMMWPPDPTRSRRPWVDAEDYCCRYTIIERISNDLPF